MAERKAFRLPWISENKHKPYQITQASCLFPHPVYNKDMIFFPGHSGHLMLSSLWCASSPQRAWRAAAELVGWCVLLKRSNAASLEASPLPNSRRPWKNTRSWTCGRSTKPAAASHLSEKPLKSWMSSCTRWREVLLASNRRHLGSSFFLLDFSVARVKQNGDIFRCCYLCFLKIPFLCCYLRLLVHMYVTVCVCSLKLLRSLTLQFCIFYQL